MTWPLIFGTIIFTVSCAAASLLITKFVQK